MKRPSSFKVDGMLIKNTLVVLNIMEATVMRISKVFSEMKFNHILNDNESCYSNNFTHAALQFICDHYGIQLLRVRS